MPLVWRTYIEIDIAILAGVVNFLPHPSPPRTRGEGVRNSQMIRIAIDGLLVLSGAVIVGILPLNCR